MSEEVIIDVSELKVGTRYEVYTIEPQGTVKAGKFYGFRFNDYVDLEKSEFLEELPEHWEERYPVMVFENAEFEDHYLFEGSELP